jgi:CRISPR/Cas system-associated exonuclease Cas4 (RecB family)
MNGIKGLKYIDGVRAFPISWLHKKGFCEYQLYLEKVKGIEVEETPEMIIGKAIHEEKERKFLEEAEIEMSVEDALAISKETGQSFLVRELETNSKRFGVYGWIDEVQIHPEKIVIIDDKPGSIAYSGLKKQVMAYSLSFLDQFMPEREVFCVLRNRDNGVVFWEERFNEELFKYITREILEVHDLLNDARIPLATTNPQKCAKCRLRKFCDKSLV